jgi:hypothetical protein
MIELKVLELVIIYAGLIAWVLILIMETKE